MKKESGITLVALVVTIVVLLILAGITLTFIIGDNSVFKQASKAKLNMDMAKAREKLELVLLVDAATEKKINFQYNQEEFLNTMILEKIQGSEIKGDIAIVDNFAFELDRSVPKIGRSLGIAKNLVFPTVNVTAQLAENKKNATIHITALEEKKGISKIEIWLLGEKIEEYRYDNVRTEITIEPPYTVTQNGKYTIKVYGDLWISETIEVTGIVTSVTFEPNGNNKWNKAHSTRVTIQETEDKVVKAKYCWTDSITEPEDNQFTEKQTFRSGDTITENGLTGIYYLWTMLETQENEKVKWRSEGFHFDSEGPQIMSFSAEKYSIDGIILSATAQDIKSGIVRFEFYIDGKLKDTQTCQATSSVTKASKTITGLTTGEHNCKVIVYDARDNNNSQTISGTTKLYAWEKWNCEAITHYVPVVGDVEFTYSECGTNANHASFKRADFDETTGFQATRYCHVYSLFSMLECI